MIMLTYLYFFLMIAHFFGVQHQNTTQLAMMMNNVQTLICGIISDRQAG